ncbi:hypothetical protein EVG20_g2360 [Dentipellis fragilis]|uniref:Secreted protein n=1 Tax=Dentipellis fragilis TaxID=205917 RepID=A0A4Y9Z7Z9_9AGAM|nr:hypothetical protein EVG20_g2360 [Dentipellis fragilis]
MHLHLILIVSFPSRIHLLPAAFCAQIYTTISRTRLLVAGSHCLRSLGACGAAAIFRLCLSHTHHRLTRTSTPPPYCAFIRTSACAQPPPPLACMLTRPPIVLCAALARAHGFTTSISRAQIWPPPLPPTPFHAVTPPSCLSHRARRIRHAFRIRTLSVTHT